MHKRDVDSGQFFNLKHLKWSIVSGIASAGVSLLTYGRSMLPIFQGQLPTGVGSAQLYVSIIVGFIIGLLIGQLLGMIKDHAGHLDEARRLIAELKPVWPGFVKFADLMKRHPNFLVPVSKFAEESTDKNFNVIPKVSPEDFYEKLKLMLDFCKAWDGVHQGPIHLLALEEKGHGQDERRNVVANSYYKKLNGKAEFKKEFTARRMLILKKEEENELEDRQIMRDFSRKPEIMCSRFE
jgi:hypothetical protein